MTRSDPAMSWYVVHAKPRREDLVRVQLEPSGDHSRVRWTSGVKRVLGTRDQPEASDDALASVLEERMGPKGYIVQRPVLRRGPFAGLNGVVTAPSTGAERVRVLLTLFSRGTTVEVEGRDLVRLGHGC